ncbi:hypothetical protein E2I00_017549 [Balaenoptera physalus]|uniref:Xin actin-binding repeat-containing protein 1 n=1 Tax=Balaenoptera physalus TaxID=9770 RepID=A0A643BS00_BALPH|nr:hypothetical protein E2I00_017549 [Balaenoptera physalus]
MRWIFENWRLDAIGDHDRPPAKEPVPSGNVQATSRKFEEGSFANSTDQEPAGPRPSGGDVRAARWLFETKPLDELTGHAEAPEATVREPAASGDVQGTRMLFETRPLDCLGSCPSIQEQSPLELRSEIQELKGDVKKTVKLFQTEPLCAIQDAEGAIHEVKAACREEIQSNAVRSARWLFETQPLDAINRDPSQVRVIRGISLEEVARPDVSATRWIFETQPLDAIREILVDEKDFQPSPDLIPPGPDMQPLDTLRDKVQVGHLQRVGPQEGERFMYERLSSDGSSALSLSQSAPQRDGVKGDVKTFKNLFETLPLDSIRQGEASAHGSISRAEGTDSAGQSQDIGSPVYAMQDGKGHLHALTSVSREHVVGGDVQGYRWMFETQPLDQLGQNPSTVDVVRGITRQEVVAGDVGTARWLFETQPLEVIHQREQQERREEEGKPQGGPQLEASPKGDVQTIRWLFETCPMSELGEKQGSEITDSTPKAKARSSTWMFTPQPPDRPESSREQHLEVSQVQAGERQTDRHVFETEPLQVSGHPCRRGPVRYCSRVDIPSGQVSRQKEVFQALEAGKRENQGSRVIPEPIPTGSVHKFTWLFENCPMGSLAAESIQGGNHQEEQPVGPSGNRVWERQQTAVEGTLRTLHATPGILHHGGIVMEARGPGELCLAKYVLPGPGQGGPHVRKEELVSGELPRIVRQVLHRPDVDQQGLLVQEDPVGQLHLKPLKLPAPGSSWKVEDMDPEFQQLLACGLGTSVARTGLVMQETEQGLVALTAYSLQPRLTSRAPERSSVQMLASCIDKGDLSGLHSLRWEPPADSSPVPASEGAQRLPLTESIIRVPPLDPSMGMGHLRGPGATPCPPQAIRKAVPLAREEKQESRCTGQKGMEALGKSDGATTMPLGPKSPNLQAAMQSLRMATAEAQSLHQQVLSKHKQGPTPGAASMPSQDSLLQVPATATGTAQSNTRPLAGGDPRIPAAPRKVSGEQKALPGGLPRGWVTIQDGIYTAHPIRTFDLPGGVWPSERGALPRGRETALPSQAPSPLLEGPGQSLGPGQEEPGSHTQKAWGPPEKVMAGLGPGVLQAAETTLKAAPLAPHTLASGPQAAGASLHSHNASVPPPPPLPAAVTGPDFPAQAGHDENSIQQASEPTQDPLLQSRPLTGCPSPQPSLPAPLTTDHDPRPTKVPTTAGQGRVSRAGCSTGQSQHSPQHDSSTVAPRPTKRKKCTDSSQQGVPESPKILQGSQQELQGLLSQVQALEKEAKSAVDVRALRRLFEAVPQLRGAPPAPAAPHKPEASVEQAFGELTRVSTEVARLKEQTLARLLDIEEAVHKALSSMSSLQPGNNTRGRAQGPLKDHSAHNVSVTDSSRVRPNCPGQEVRSQTAVKSQTEGTCHTEVQGQAKVRNHTEVRSQAAPTTPSTRRLETLREESSLPRVLPPSRDSPSSPTFISIESATRKLLEAPSPRCSPEVSVKSTHLPQDVGQAQPRQKDVWNKAGKKEATQYSGQPQHAPASASPLPTRRQKSVLELQTGPGGSQHYGATRTVTEQYERVDQCRTSVLTSPTTVTEPAEPPRGPGPHLGLHASPLLRQFLHSPAGLSTGLAEAGKVCVPCGHSQPDAQ